MRKYWFHKFLALVIVFIGLWFSFQLIKYAFFLWKLHTPFPDGLPQGEIVFMPFESHPRYGHSADDITADTLGFINSDGSGHTEYRFPIIGGSLDMLGMRRYTYLANSPTWSHSGQMILFSIRDSGPNIRGINNVGDLLGQDCYLVSYASGLDRSDYIFGSVDKNAPIWELYKPEAVDGGALWVRISLPECEIVDYFTLPTEKGESYLSLIGETPTGYIVASYYLPDSKEYILFANPNKNVFYSIRGYYPSLSDDGEYLSYFLDNTLIVRNIETQQEKELVLVPDDQANSTYHPSPASWSPDRKWLVYSTSAGEIYKLNIDTLEQYFLVNGWFPNWK